MTDNTGENSNSPTLPPFPVDDFTLDQLAHALNTTVDGPVTIPFVDQPDDGARRLIGGEFTLSQYLDFLSGFDHRESTQIGEIEGIRIYEAATAIYSEHDVIRALIGEVRRLRAEQRA